MQIQQVNRESVERVFMNVLNAEGATITAGLPVALAQNVSNDGVKAVICNAAADFPGFIGVSMRDIPDNDYGQVQISGFVNSILISNVGSSLTIAVGSPLVPSPAGFFSAAPSYANSGFRWLTAQNVPVALSAASYASGLLRMI